jgi:hypothetical protein
LEVRVEVGQTALVEAVTVENQDHWKQGHCLVGDRQSCFPLDRAALNPSAALIQTGLEAVESTLLAVNADLRCFLPFQTVVVHRAAREVEAVRCYFHYPRIRATKNSVQQELYRQTGVPACSGSIRYLFRCS